MSDLVFYGASDDLVEVEGACIVEGRHVKRKEFTLPTGDEVRLMLVYEDQSMGVVVSYRGVSDGIWALAPVVLREGGALPWRVSITDGTSYEGVSDNYPGDYSMVLTVHDVPDGVTVVGPEYDGD